MFVEPLHWNTSRSVNNPHPQAVYGNLTVALSLTFNSRFFRIFGAIYSVTTLILWTGVFIRTVGLVRNAQIFEAPCLEDIDMTRFVERRGE